MRRPVLVTALVGLVAVACPAVGKEDGAALEALERRLEEQQRELDALREELRRARQAQQPPPADEPGEPARATAAPAASEAPTGPAQGAVETTPAGGGGGAAVRARFGEGVTITGADDSLSLTIRARFQARFTHLEREERGSATLFEIRRARLLLRGHALTRELTYYMQLGFSNQDTEPDLRLPLRDAYLTYAGLRDLNVRVGQMKVPFNPQRVTSSSALQLVDRSIVQNELNLDRDVGVQVFSDDLFGLGGVLGYALGVFGGDGRNRLSDAGGVLLVARVQLTPFGRFDDLVEADLARSPDPRLALGAAVAHNANTNRERSTFGGTYASRERTDQTHVVTDLHLKWMGFSLRSEALLREAADEVLTGTVGGATVTERTRSAWGYFAQAGYLVTDEVEVVARWGELRPLGRSAVRLQRETGGGINWYVSGHDLKLQADYFYLWGERLADGDHQVRVQLQLFF
ncbi:MAG: OprO/OprP family phosphate-selective porin [Planctomycetes bacterium]|nr:OprO/OprP family phosphate-selective porin [Planctomycetota bacterium]